MTTWVSKHVRARIAHNCVLCYRRIDPGETYLRGTGLDNGEVWTWKECAHCSAALQLYDIQWDDTYREDDFDCWVTDGWRTIAELRAQASYRMGWRTKYGTLLPVPTRGED